MGLFTKTKSKPVMVTVIPHYCNGHPSTVLPLLKKAGVDLVNPEDYVKWTSGESGRWYTSYVLFMPSHLAKKLAKLNDKKKVFQSFNISWGSEGYIRRSYPDLEKEQTAIIKPN